MVFDDSWDGARPAWDQPGADPIADLTDMVRRMHPTELPAVARFGVASETAAARFREIVGPNAYTLDGLPIEFYVLDQVEA